MLHAFLISPILNTGHMPPIHYPFLSHHLIKPVEE
jgi:hypothetical protein